MSRGWVAFQDRSVLMTAYFPVLGIVEFCIYVFMLLISKRDQDAKQTGRLKKQQLSSNDKKKKNQRQATKLTKNGWSKSKELEGNIK